MTHKSPRGSTAQATDRGVVAAPDHDTTDNREDECCSARGGRSATDELAIAECRLELDGLRTQRERYRRLGAAARHVTRHPQTLSVEFTPAVDADLVEETLAVERDCCPFFALHYDAATRRLTARVGAPEQDPALDALVAALEAGGRLPPQRT